MGKGDMRIVKNKKSSTSKTGESNFVAKHYTPWNSTFENCKYLIPFRVDKKFLKDNRKKNELMDAFEQLESNSTLKFINQTDQESYLHCTDGYNCKSYVGQQKKRGPQKITLGPGCWYYYTIVHEVDVLNSS